VETISVTFETQRPTGRNSGAGRWGGMMPPTRLLSPWNLYFGIGGGWF
jgi:hypothetical protein